MAKFILKKIAASMLVVLFVSVLVFLIMHLIPGDPVRLMMGIDATQEEVDAVKAELNLDKPLPQQYLLWIQDIAKGDFGVSLVRNTDVGELIRVRFPITLSLAVFEILLGVLFGIILGIISATRRGRASDQIITVLTTTGAGIPVFWIAIILIFLFGLKLRWLPISGYTSPTEDLGEFIKQAILPVICLTLGFLSIMARQTRTNMLEVINQDYIRTARADGLSENRILYRHALKNAMIPIVTVIGLQTRAVLGGSVLVEQVFSIPGVGQLMITSLLNRDYLVVQACVLVLSVMTVIINLLLEIAYGLFDPRIRFAQENEG